MATTVESTLINSEPDTEVIRLFNIEDAKPPIGRPGDGRGRTYRLSALISDDKEGIQTRPNASEKCDETKEKVKEKRRRSANRRRESSSDVTVIMANGREGSACGRESRNRQQCPSPRPRNTLLEGDVIHRDRSRSRSRQPTGSALRGSPLSDIANAGGRSSHATNTTTSGGSSGTVTCTTTEDGSSCQTSEADRTSSSRRQSQASEDGNASGRGSLATNDEGRGRSRDSGASSNGNLSRFLALGDQRVGDRSSGPPAAAEHTKRICEDKEGSETDVRRSSERPKSALGRKRVRIVETATENISSSNVPNNEGKPLESPNSTRPTTSQSNGSSAQSSASGKGKTTSKGSIAFDSPAERITKLLERNSIGHDSEKKSVNRERTGSAGAGAHLSKWRKEHIEDDEAKLRAAQDRTSRRSSKTPVEIAKLDTQRRSISRPRSRKQFQAYKADILSYSGIERESNSRQSNSSSVSQLSMKTIHPSSRSNSIGSNVSDDHKSAILKLRESRLGEAQMKIMEQTADDEIERKEVNDGDIENKTKPAKTSKEILRNIERIVVTEKRKNDELKQKLDRRKVVKNEKETANVKTPEVKEIIARKKEDRVVKESRRTLARAKLSPRSNADAWGIKPSESSQKLLEKRGNINEVVGISRATLFGKTGTTSGPHSANDTVTRNSTAIVTDDNKQFDNVLEQVQEAQRHESAVTDGGLSGESASAAVQDSRPVTAKSGGLEGIGEISSEEVRELTNRDRNAVYTVGDCLRWYDPDDSQSGHPYLKVPAYSQAPSRQELLDGSRRQYTDDIRRWWRGRQREAEKDRRTERDQSLSRYNTGLSSATSVSESPDAVEKRKFESMKSVAKRPTNCSKGVSDNLQWDDSLSNKTLPKLSRSLTEPGKVVEGGASCSVPAPPPAGSPRSSVPNTRRSQQLLRKPSLSKFKDAKPLAKSTPASQLEEDVLRRTVLSRPTYTWSIKLTDADAEQTTATDKALPPVGQLSPGMDDKDKKKHFFVHPKWESEKIGWRLNGSKMKTGWI